MLWFHPKKIKVRLRDPILRSSVLKMGPHILSSAEMFQKNPQVIDRYFPKEAKILREVKKFPLANRRDYGEVLGRILRGKYVFRGINPRDYKIFLREGNSKNEENVSVQELELLKNLNLKPSEVLYGSQQVMKAWEFASKHNPSILVAYKEDHLMHVNNYLWKLKQGTFKEAMEAIIIIIC